METFIRVVGFGEDGCKLAERLCRNAKKGPFGKEKDYELLDYMTIGSEERNRVKECFSIGDAENVDHKLMLLVIRVDGPAAISVIPIFYRCAKITGWDLGVMMLRSEERPDNGWPKWTDLPEGHCDFFTVFPTDTHNNRAFDCIAGLISLLKNQWLVRIDYTEFKKMFFDGGEVKFQSCYAPQWCLKTPDEMNYCILQVQHAPNFTMCQMQKIANVLPNDIECIINCQNIMEEGCPAIVNAWYKE